jgi:hypothetical protein
MRWTADLVTRAATWAAIDPKATLTQRPASLRFSRVLLLLPPQTEIYLFISTLCDSLFTIAMRSANRSYEYERSVPLPHGKATEFPLIFY